MPVPGTSVYIEDEPNNAAHEPNPIPHTEKGQPGGVATLDVGGLVPVEQIPGDEPRVATQHHQQTNEVNGSAVPFNPFAGPPTFGVIADGLFLPEVVVPPAPWHLKLTAELPVGVDASNAGHCVVAIFEGDSELERNLITLAADAFLPITFSTRITDGDGVTRRTFHIRFGHLVGEMILNADGANGLSAKFSAEVKS